MYKKIILRNEQIKKTVTISEDSSSFVLVRADMGTAKVTNNTTRFLNLLGEHLDSIAYEPRDISLEGCIIANSESEMSFRKNLLNRTINPGETLILEYLGHVLYMKPDSSIRYNINSQSNNEILCYFQIIGTCLYPLYERKKKNVLQKSKFIETTLFPLKIPKRKGIAFGYIPLDSIETPYNTGDVPVSFSTKLTAVGGEVVNPSLENNLTKKHIRVNQTLSSGDSIEIQTDLRGQYVKHFSASGLESNSMRYLSDDSELDMTIYVGLNNFSLDAEKGKEFLVGETIFAPSFVEVER